MLVSVAVITYNMERYLRPLLDSILKQKVNFEYEIVIDDDCSPDNSRKIIKEYQEKYPDIIKTSFRNKNVGGSRNMYDVMQQCSGKYIAILEGDDFWEDEEKLQYQVEFLEKNPEYIGMTCNSWCEHGEEVTAIDLMRRRTEPKVFCYDDFMARHFHDRLPTSTDTWVFRNIFKEYPDEDFSLFYKAHNMVWDQSLALILYGKGNIYVDPKIVSHHRTIVEKDGTNYQSKYARENHSDTDAYMYAMHEEYMENVLHRNCKPFYKVRGRLFAEQFFIALKNRREEDKKRVKRMWNQRKVRQHLVYECVIWGCESLSRKVRKLKG